jgi:hypothetical protein
MKQRPYVNEEDGRRGMDELSAKRKEERGGEGHQRIAALMARVDAGDAGSLEALERRLRDDHEVLAHEGKTELAEAVYSWGMARCEELGLADAYFEQEAAYGAPPLDAPGRWVGLRVRVSYLGGGGTQRPSQLVGRLAEVGERGVLVAVDELEEDRDGDEPAGAGTIARRVRSARLICWPALLGVMLLPVCAVGGEVR